MWAAPVAILAACIAGCGDSDGASTPTVYAAFVLLAPGSGGDTIAVARAIVAPGRPQCPTLEAPGARIPMSARRNPHAFPVVVCEASIPFGLALRLSWNQQELPAARLNPRRLLIIGDTGCSTSDCPGEQVAEPFATIASAAAGIDPAPDLILHVGDYNYRGTPGTVTVKGTGMALSVYDAGDDAPDDPQCQLDSPYVSQNAEYSEAPDAWDDWWHDFFQPAGSLLARAPFVFVRGNHELCSRGGPGWFYFLDAGAGADIGGTGQVDCPFQGGDMPPVDSVFDHLHFVPPYTLDLGTLHLAVIDSANACDGFAPEPTTQIYTEQLLQVLDAVQPGVTTWIATHRPFWGATDAATMDATPPAYDSIDATLQAAVAGATSEGSGGLPVDLRLVVAGHQHAFQSVTFFDESSARRPPQLVIGDSGVKLEHSDVDGALDATIDGSPAHVLGFAQFGFLDVPELRADGSWRAALRDPSLAVLAECDTMNPPASLCVLP